MNMVLYNPISGKGANGALEMLKTVFDPATHEFCDIAKLRISRRF